MTQHSPEPWHAGLSHESMSMIEDASGQAAFQMKESMLLDHEQFAANIERVLACVNACAGIPTAELSPPNKPGYETVASESLNLLRKFYAAGGLDAFPHGTRVTPAIQCNMQGLDLSGKRLIPDFTWNDRAAAYMLKKLGCTITGPDGKPIE